MRTAHCALSLVNLFKMQRSARTLSGLKYKVRPFALKTKRFFSNGPAGDPQPAKSVSFGQMAAIGLGSAVLLVGAYNFGYYFGYEWLDYKNKINVSASSKDDQLKAIELKEVDANFVLADPQGYVTHRVYFDISINGLQPERIVIGLYGKDCPKTVENFLTLARGDKIGEQSKIRLSYENCKFHRIIPNFMLQSGDFTRGDGTGGESIYGNPFPDEDFKFQHTGLGVLSMANRGKNTNSSQFFICTAPASWLNGKHVVFGQVLHGGSTLRNMESLGSRSGQVGGEVMIVKCGELPDLASTKAANAPDSEPLDETGRAADRIMK